MSTLPFTSKIGAILVALAAVVAAACGGGDGGAPPAETPAAPTPAAQQLTTVVVSSDLAVGPNRFAVGVVDLEAGVPVLDAQVHFRLFKLIDGDQAELRFEADPEFVGFQTFFINDTTKEKVATEDTGVYVANLEFDEIGDWGLEVTGTRNGEEFVPLRTGFTVRDAEQTLTIGDPAPRSRQLTLDDVADISEIDTASPPNPQLHDITIADAIATGKPVVVLFGTPAFCETRTCGPVLETVMLPLYDTYKDEAFFIHIEPYFLKEARENRGLCSVPVFNIELARQGIGEGTGSCPTLSADELPPAEESWNLTTEPIVFVIDQNGNIAGKFEGIVGPQEVEATLTALLAGGGGASPSDLRY